MRAPGSTRPLEDAAHLHLLPKVLDMLHHAPLLVHVSFDLQVMRRLQVAEARFQDLTVPSRGHQDHLPATVVLHPHLAVAELEGCSAGARQCRKGLEVEREVAAGLIDDLLCPREEGRLANEEVVAYGPHEVLHVLRPLEVPLPREVRPSLGQGCALVETASPCASAEALAHR
eukprot:CAMPEP_0176268408 /NCGR_PEP_ID=MMETSP0121_2-20121125/43658_1 /TAXON_ID=160619 /ORGANISM="Kryptoperidinium foliaceum, Strain CCMP 1326" /LENGTH=172 /DNA_ID=CAMNT_0017608499 /DNA_START=66 /DNA_END=580 /DNA_ORIENTATION=+